jgi:uncharacterized protein (DUF2235 family)
MERQLHIWRYRQRQTPAHFYVAGDQPQAFVFNFNRGVFIAMSMLTVMSDLGIVSDRHVELFLGFHSAITSMMK